MCAEGEGDEMLMPTQVVRGYAGTTALQPSAGWVSGGEGVLTIYHASVRLGRESLEPAVKTRALVAPRHAVSEEGDYYSQEALCRLQRNCSAPV